MRLPKSATTVTPFSKLLALILFILFPLIAFYLGALYGKSLGAASTVAACFGNTPASCAVQNHCSEEAKQCPDGTFVFRQEPNCDYAACANTKVAASITPSPATTKTGNTKEDQIAAQISKKSSIPVLDLILTYRNDTSETDSYAGGTYTNRKGGSINRWIATKINGLWMVTSISSGIPLCKDITPYYYPKDLVPACKDSKNNTIAR